MAEAELRQELANAGLDDVIEIFEAPAENVQEVLIHLVQGEGTSKARKLGYLNALVRLCYRCGANFDTGLSKKETLACLRLGLCSEAKEMRAACLRALRYYCQEKESIEALLTLKIDYLIARSLDLCLDNEVERVHALRLARKILQLCPEKFPRSLLHVMISIANDGTQERDKMVRTCLATLCEMAFYNTKLVAACGGLGCILRNILDCHQLPRVNESLLSTILYLLNHPRTRHYIKSDVDLEQMLAPFTDCHYWYCAEPQDPALGDEKENRFSACKMAIASIIKAWPGIIRLCKPDGSGLQSLLGVLYLPHMETRKEIMDLLFDIFRLSVPDWTDNFQQALLSVDPSEMRESWRLLEGFTAEEGKSILPHLAKTRPNLVDSHMALILSTFISAGLLEALVEVIATSEEHISIRACVLLGELLHMANAILPHDFSHQSHCLPSLMALATSPDISPKERNQASMAISALDRLHVMKTRVPTPCSLFLDQIIRSGSKFKEETNLPVKITAEKLLQYFDKDGDHETVNQAIKDSQVLYTKDNTSWDWDLISAILKWPDESLKKMDDQFNQRFVRRLLYFFKPTNKLFSNVDLAREDCQKLAVTGLNFIDFLLECDSEEGHRVLEEWLLDISQCLSEVCSAIQAQRAPLDALFSTSVLHHTCSQYFFLFIGRLSKTPRGEKFLETTGIHTNLHNILGSNKSNETYVKLVVSSLDYSRDGVSRTLLSKALSSTNETSRLYSVNFMRVLLRARVPFLTSWGIELLVNELYDQSKAVAMEALSVISEACEEEANLYTLVNIRPSVLHLGNKGAMLLARFLSIPAGFKFLMDANFVYPELEKWHNHFNMQYVRVVEERLNEALTTYEKTYDGSYVRRSSKRLPRKDVYVPIHLYGQLVQHKHGCQILHDLDYLSDYFDQIRYMEMKTDEQVHKMKAALWAVGHIGTSAWGIALVQEQNIIPEIVKLAEECGVFSIRGTAFFVLGLIASTRKGADMLSDLGWEAVRHKHGEVWPVLEDGMDQAYEEGDGGLGLSISSLSISSSAKSEGAIGSSVIATSVTQEQNSEASNSPRNSGSFSSSPKIGMFYIDEGGTKSRSNTGSSEAQISVSSKDSPSVSIEADNLKDSKQELKAEVSDGNKNSVVSREVSYHSQSVFCSTVGTKLDASHPSSQSDSKCAARKQDSHVFAVHFEDKRSEEGDSSSIGSGQVHNSSNRSDQEVSLTKEKGAGEHAESNDFLTVREQRSSSNESTKTTSAQTTNISWSGKGRSDSFNTDITTSGISSYESGHQGSDNPNQLTPIPSASSILTETEHKHNQSETDLPTPLVHPSDTLRKLSNLRRVPSLKRRYSNPVLGHISPHSSVDYKEPNGNAVQFSSAKDLQGYAALRELKRQQTLSADLEGDGSMAQIFEEPRNDNVNFLSKTRSLDFRMGNRASSANLRSNMSMVSLDEMEAPLTPPLSVDFSSKMSFVSNMTKLKTPKAASGRAEYVGICLPVDVGMLYQVNEGEDIRSHVPLEGYDDNDEVFPKSPGPELVPSGSVSQNGADDGLEYHSVYNCLGCFRLSLPHSMESMSHMETDPEAGFLMYDTRESATVSIAHTPNPSAGPSPAEKMLGLKPTKSMTSSLSDMGPGSVNSVTSLESSAKVQMSENTVGGRVMIRKEIIRLIVNLSSSVGVKSAEQGLLSMRQKFPSSFQDICLFSEICYQLSHYNYRLKFRRFIHELFQDVDFQQLYNEPREYLGVKDVKASHQHTEPSDIDIKLEMVLESMA